MKIYFRGWYIEIWSTKLFTFFVKMQMIPLAIIFSGFGLIKKSRKDLKHILKMDKDSFKNMFGLAYYPFLVVNPYCMEKNTDTEWKIPFMINHEKIHLRQQIELPFGIFLAFKMFQQLYNNHKRKDLTSEGLYLKRVEEQEAYLNMHNLDYLKTRKPYAFLNFLKKKEEINIQEIWTKIEESCTTA